MVLVYSSITLVLHKIEHCLFFHFRNVSESNTNEQYSNKLSWTILEKVCQANICGIGTVLLNVVTRATILCVT